jgi:crotonobetainyl-CoA:carnitine CoA-transferase CaiB-like acyl-CoA transferase
MLPLEDIKVLDFSTLLPGPLAGLVLAEAGAEVIKVERPEFGEEMRHYRPQWGEESVIFSLLNRGKQSLALDLKNPAHRDSLKPLIKQTDIVIEQFRPGVMARLGLDYETMKAWNPKLIYCSITGYGQTGPKAPQAGHDLNYIGDTGLLDLSMGTADHPVLPPALIADIAGGSYPAIVNILMALIARHKTGKGCYLDIAMTDHMFMLTTWALGQGLATGNWPKTGKGMLTGGSPRYQIYPTKDGKFVAAAPLEQKFWQRFCQTIGLSPKLAADDKNAEKVIVEIRKIMAGKTADHWQPLLAKADCCCSIVKTLEEAVGDAHVKARHLFEQQIINEKGDEMPALPVCLVPAFRDSKTRGAPKLGSLDNKTQI